MAAVAERLVARLTAPAERGPGHLLDGSGVISTVVGAGSGSPRSRRIRSAPEGQRSTAASTSPALARSGSIHGRLSLSNTSGRARTQFCEW
jgi:hypothetical protein